MQAILSFLVSSAGIAIGVVIKTLWDQVMARRTEIARLRRDKRIALLERQLSEFYWPIYIRLEKDNLIWKKVFDADEGIDPAARQTLEESYLLPNHQEIMDILSGKIYLARASQPLMAALSAYMRHIAVYQSLRRAGIGDRNPVDFGEPYPAEIFGLLEAEKTRLQAEYDGLLGLV